MPYDICILTMDSISSYIYLVSKKVNDILYLTLNPDKTLKERYFF